MGYATAAFRIISTIVVCALSAVTLPFNQAAAEQQAARSAGSVSGSTRASTDSTWGALDGSIRDTAGTWLVGVEVVAVDNIAIRTRSRAAGVFRIDSISSGPHLIRFRRIGIVPLTVSVVVQPNATTSIDAVVKPMTLVLTRINIQGKSGELLRLPPGVADRMRNGMGHYITSAEIAAEHPLKTSEIFRRVAGLQVIGGMGSEYVVNNRGVSMLGLGGVTPWTGCESGMHVFIDGAGVDATGDASTSISITGAGAFGAINTVLPNDIEAIEIYKDAVEGPASLEVSDCGAIYIWTKR